MAAPRSSVFSFESSAHPSRVLRRLDEQRRRDALCDVTLLVQGRSFRAHGAVLASCSEYFSSRAPPQGGGHGAVLTLPPEVTVSGFEPLLQFAYTSKLLFGKDDVLDIRTAASVLGFRDLDDACFDFLLPKFFCSSSAQGAAPFPRKTCCKKKCQRGFSGDGEKEAGPVGEPRPPSPRRQEAPSLGGESQSDVETGGGSSADGFTQCPKYRKFQLACGKETLVRDEDGGDAPQRSGLDDPSRPSEAEAHGGKTEGVSVKEDPWEREEEEGEGGEASERSTGSPLHRCPFGGGLIAGARDPASVHQEEEGGDETRGAGLTGGSVDTDPPPPEPRDPNSSAWNLGCPFLQDLDRGRRSWQGAGSECEAASQSGVSSLCSGEDGYSDTEGDGESSAQERARQVQLPFSVDWVVDLSRNDFQQLLKRRAFTHEQLEFVHDMRRRSKNRLAAQRCRKRKLDCIYNLQCEINKLKSEREKLLAERNQLSQQKVRASHSVSALCRRVCGEAELRPEQLQVLARYSSPDCPLSSFQTPEGASSASVGGDAAAGSRDSDPR